MTAGHRQRSRELMVRVMRRQQHGLKRVTALERSHVTGGMPRGIGLDAVVGLRHPCMTDPLKSPRAKQDFKSEGYHFEQADHDNFSTFQRLANLAPTS